ncbi:hypothetical protein SLS62_009280 [Diatrype stigma]|uniref:Uncharacterized protein n=1 Tax=Diatrype stigma TaxID=117547 RepID=A0AAN9UQD1_9PEZI
MASYGEVPRIPSPGHTAYPGSSSQARLAYEPQAPFYPPPSRERSRSRSQSRPRTLPPPIEYRNDARSSRELVRTRRPDPYDDDDDDGDLDSYYGREVSDHGGSTARTPAAGDKAAAAAARGGFLGNKFTDTPAGLGVGVLGALVGGLAAKEASNATSRHGKKHRSGDPDHRRNQMISTAVGAVVGALGANAFEKRLEDNRGKEKEQRAAAAAKEDNKWEYERRWRSDGRNGSSRVLDKTEIIARPRSRSGGAGSRDRSSDGSSRRRSRSRAGVNGSGWRKDWEPWDERERDRDHRRSGGNGRGVEREVDTQARSWKDVEDWVYDDAKSGSGSRPSLDEYRY